MLIKCIQKTKMILINKIAIDIKSRIIKPQRLKRQRTHIKDNIYSEKRKKDQEKVNQRCTKQSI